MEAVSGNESDDDAPRKRRIMIENSQSRTLWVPVSDDERALISQALDTLDALPEPDVEADVFSKPDKLAIGKVQGPGNPSRLIVFRIHYLGNTEIWLQNDTSSIPPRRIVALPEHEGAKPPRVLPKSDTKQSQILRAVLPPDVFANTDIERIRTQTGAIWIQGYGPNEWEELAGDGHTAVVHAIAAIRLSPVHYTDTMEHIVTLIKSTGTASMQVFRSPDYRLWLAEFNKGAGKPKWFRLVIIAGEHHPVPRV